MGRLSGKVAAITGGCGGIGSAIASRFAEEGALVAICDMAGERAEMEAAQLANKGFQAVGMQIDVASEESWKTTVQALLSRVGGIDILVNSAGINDRGTIMATDLVVWNRTFGVNLIGPMLGMRNVAPIMRSKGGGAIVNTCSLASLQGEDHAAYGASKWALRGLTKIAAMEFVDWKIRVNSVSPAVVETTLNTGQPYLRPMAEMTPMGRNGQAVEIANTILFLASDEASYITGQDIAVDGGFSAGAGVRYARKLAREIQAAGSA